MEKFLYKRNTNKSTKYNVWFTFPGCYSFAMSSLGFLHLFKTLDIVDDINVERIYTDTNKTLIKYGDVNVICFSMSFDMDFISVFQIFEKYSIPFKSKDRDDKMPIIFAGGPVITSNPIPYSEIFDFMIIGDGEIANTEAIKFLKDNKDLPKRNLLEELAKIDGIYVPSVNQEKILKNTCQINECIYTPILSDEAFFKNTFIVETSRGCANCCNFCMASYLNLPVRFAPYENIIKTIDFGLQYTNDIALLGAQVSIHPKFKQICNYIYERTINNKNIKMGISSLRVDAVEDDIAKTLAAAGQKHVTIAIETGSERLRQIIKKNITEEQIINTVETLNKNGLKGVKIYAMIGIPTETNEDIQDTINLAKKLKHLNKGFDISFAFSSFTPKPFTPFQWYGRFDTKILEHRQNYLKKELHKLGIGANFSSIKWDYWQAVLSRGDINMSDFMIDVYKNGSKLGAFKKSAKGKFNPDDYALRIYQTDEILPWDVIDMRPGKSVLKERFLQKKCTACNA